MTGPAGTAALVSAFGLIRATIDNDAEGIGAMHQASSDEQVVIMVALADIAAELLAERAARLGLTAREQVDILAAAATGQRRQPIRGPGRRRTTKERT